MKPWDDSWASNSERTVCLSVLQGNVLWLKQVGCAVSCTCYCVLQREVVQLIGNLRGKKCFASHYNLEAVIIWHWHCLFCMIIWHSVCCVVGATSKFLFFLKSSGVIAEFDLNACVRLGLSRSKSSLEFSLKHWLLNCNCNDCGLVRKKEKMKSVCRYKAILVKVLERRFW